MNALLFSAFIMGGLGSFHCVGMCGPIALSLPVGSANNINRFLGTFLYNLGRITTYSLIGVLAGAIGNSFSFWGFGQWLSVFLGIAILLFFMFPNNRFSHNNLLQNSFSYLRNVLGRMLSGKLNSSAYSIGLLNGLLPCGLLYLAIPGAIATASPLKSGLFMAAFGLGTLPLMWTLSFWGSLIKLKARQRLKKIYPALMICMAILLIVRGLGLGIPYISPSHHLQVTGTAETIKCHD